MKFEALTDHLPPTSAGCSVYPFVLSALRPGMTAVIEVKKSLFPKNYPPCFFDLNQRKDVDKQQSQQTDGKFRSVDKNLCSALKVKLTQ